MKITIIAMALITICYNTLAQTTFPIEPKMKRFCKINKSNMLQLIKKNKINFEVIVPSGSNKQLVKAGRELVGLLSKATGQKINLRNKKSGKLPAILLGDKALREQCKINTTSFDRDGFVIKTVKNNIVIAGRDGGAEHGTLFGVYDFLERFAEMRFYFPGDVGTIIPKLSDWQIPCIDIQDRPDFKVRNIYWWANSENLKKKPEWYDTSNPKIGMRLNWERLRLQTMYIPSCHGLAYLDLVKRFGKSNPEYFAMKADGSRILEHRGHLCFNSEVKEEIYKDVVAALTGKPASSRGIKFWRSNHKRPFSDIMPNDGMIMCLCDKCKAYKSNQEISDLIWEFVITTAERLKIDKIEGYITFLSYPPYNEIPARNIPNNVLVMKAVTGPYMEKVELKRKFTDKIIQDWNKNLNRKIWLWNYAHKINCPSGIPNMTPCAIGSFYSRMSPHIFGAFLESETDFYLSNYLGYYVFGKVAWNNKVNIDELLNEHYVLMFGKAAGSMCNFFDILEDKWLKQIVGRQVNTNLGPQVIQPSSFELWNKIYSPSEINRINKIFDNAENAVKNDAISLKRVKFMRKEIWAKVLKAAADYKRKSCTREQWTCFFPKLSKGNIINIDGKLTEPFWRKQKALYLIPFKSEKAEINTKVYLAHDTKKMYIAFECDEPFTDKMVIANRNFDDKNIWRDSGVEIFLNPTGDKKNYIQFIINALGCFADLRNNFPTNYNTANYNWNSTAIVKTSVVPGKKWCMEIAIPLDKIGKLNSDGFKVNFNRNRILNNKVVKTKLYTWSPFIKNGFNEVENFGTAKFKQSPDHNLLKCGDFAGLKHSRFIGGVWAANKDIYQDKQVFLSSGVSLRMNNSSGWVRQSLPKLKPDTEYILSFYMKLKNVKQQAKHSGFYTRISDGSGRARYLPLQPYYGTIPWTRQEFKIKTHKNLNKTAPFLAFIFRKADGNAWIDNVKFVEALTMSKK